MYTCSQPFEASTSLTCLGAVVQTYSATTGNYYAYCPTVFSEDAGGYVICSTAINSTADLSTVPVGSYLFESTAYTSTSGQFQYPFNLTSSPVEFIQANTVTESSLILNGLVSEFNPTAFALLLLATITGMTTGFIGGMITGAIRKIKNARI